MEQARFEDLLGRTIASIEGAEKGSEFVRFVSVEGDRWVQQHHQDCCECVLVEDVAGDVGDIIGSPILLAEEVTSETSPDNADPFNEAELWTFYKLATIKGYVTIRWFGASNGYYGVGVDFDHEP